MKSNTLKIASIALLLILSSIFSFAKDSNRVPNKVAKEWHDNLHGSPYSVYENFDGIAVEYSSIEKHLTDTIHLKFFMGCNSADNKKMDYRMFMIFINGEEVEDGYTNDYSLILYSDNNQWILTDKDELDKWTTNWKNYQSEKGLNPIRAFVIPNDDIKELNMKDIFLSFGLEKVTPQDSVKLLLCNQKYKPSDNQTNTKKFYADEVVYMDACMPCPKVCGHGDE